MTFILIFSFSVPKQIAFRFAMTQSDIKWNIWNGKFIKLVGNVDVNLSRIVSVPDGCRKSAGVVLLLSSQSQNRMLPDL